MSTTYIAQARVALIAELQAADPAVDWDTSPLTDLYVLLALVRGTECTSGDVHEAWAVDCHRLRPSHKSLLPFGDLSPEVQAYDDRYRDAIHRAATTLGGAL